MFAIVETGGKQYRVAPGDVIQVEKLPVEEGAQVELEKVLFLAQDDGVKVGAPYLEGARVKARVLRHGKGRKIIVMKFKKRKNYRRKRGHRQLFTELKITEI
ncbi:MAG: 50S ribosomal protein L21 [Aquificota bacterium]|uniref:Large ribosomal subunit protein bL21 n=1 Tax=Thermosulfidibacter takaii TaxID=412593 RepID=A0A7C0Y9B2_9BACT|nr:MAG: 50S ribosomal protein L21 [Aquificota bacterium]HDD53197.1 50S ribosomal protein L21 [Thermosulfidibacter takaii]